MIMKYRLYYGIINKHLDVTTICSEKCICNDVLYITNDQYQRDQLFTDPAVGHDKFYFSYRERHICLQQQAACLCGYGYATTRQVYCL